MDESVFRQALALMLRGGQAHVTLEGALEGLAPELRGRRPANGLHAVWELLEHMRITQKDILRYTLDPSWTSPPWPKGYWPERKEGGEGEEVTDETWQETRKGFEHDLAELVALAEDESRELSAEIPHGEGRSYLRQLLLVADHNAYHLGQIIDTRRALGAWPP